jgi:mannose-6-phosphate isomerase-like protein (cupin superfamily)
MKLWMIADGTAKVRWAGGHMTLAKGQTVLFPASMPPNATATFSTNGTVLETTVK